ncbi:metallophosphoesterase family protein [bacterium]|nr:metallophosphoesterase family protein [bacterium]
MNELKNKLKYLINKRKSLLEICEELELKDYEVIGLVELMKQDGELIDYVNGQIIKLQKPIRTNEVYEVPNIKEHLKLLLISDTHLASKYDRLDILRYLYGKAEDDGVNYVLHSGDVTEGRSNREEQVYELKEISYTGQRDYVIDKYPRSEIPTYMISGNHDLWWVKRSGADIVKDICNHREDLIYLGSDCEDLKIGKLRIRLFHGKGGSSYAKSYKLQKYLDSVLLEERPHILQTGHIHQAFYMKQDKTHCFQTGCLQDLTPFERSMGFGNDKSCWWVDVYMDDKGNPIQITQELEIFTKKYYRR